MNAGRRPHLIWAAIGLLVLVSVATALAAGNAVPQTGAGVDTDSINANKLKPPECAGLNLTAVVTGSGVVIGSNANELILGSSAVDAVDSRNGDDCVLGGGHDDMLLGRNGDDVLLGGAGNDDLNGGPGYDICYGGGGSNSFIQCEEIY